MSQDQFEIVEASIESIHAAFKAGTLTARQLVQGYLDRIAAYDKQGPSLNAIICLNPDALADAAKLDADYAKSGPVGPLHGIVVVMKDQGDVKGLPTTLGSKLFKDFYPDRDATVIKKLRKAGAIILGKSTLGELGGGDTHGSLFGSTRNVFDLDRTAGGSSGGSAVSVSANFCTVAVAQEGLASIRRPSIWNGIVGMRPTAGLVSRHGVFAGWPSKVGSMGPMARTVTDLAKLLDFMVGYDEADPVTAYGVGKIPKTYTEAIDVNGLKGARIGVMREPMGYMTEPDTEDFRKVTEVFDKAIQDLRKAGATVIDSVVIPGMNELMKTRTENPGDDEVSFQEYFVSTGNSPYKNRDEVRDSPLFKEVVVGSQKRWNRTSTEEGFGIYLKAREELMTRMLKVMADNQLDALVHKAVEHTPTLIKDGVNPPFVDQKGAPSINTFLVFVPSIVVPAGFTRDGLPAGITFLGRAYDDAKMIKYASAYEAISKHRVAPSTTPELVAEAMGK